MASRAAAPGSRRAGFVLIPLFVLLAAGITAAGYFSYRSYERHFRTEVGHQLSAVAELKVGDLAQWRTERLADGSVFLGNSAFSDLVRRWFEAPDDVGTQARIRAWLGNVQAAYQYDRVILLDARGVPRLSVPETPEPEAAHLSRDALEVLRSGRVGFLDLHRDLPGEPVHLAVLVPILEGAEHPRPLGVLLLRIDPERYLYPFLQRWPISSRTAETLLVRRDGNDVLFLNELRFQKNTALTLRQPLTQTNLPAVKAALGQEGVEEGVDYRGVPVLAAVRVVPDSPWSLVARMDTAEVEAPLRERRWMLVELVFVTLLAAGAGVGFLWRQQDLRSARERYRAAEDLNQSEARFRLVAESAPIGMAQADPRTGKWLSVNPKMCTITGYSESELLGLRVPDITHPDDRAADWEAFQRVVRDETPSYRIEKRYLRKDGSETWVNVNMTVLRDAAGQPVRTMAAIEDISERKKAEAERDRLTQQRQLALDSARMGWWHYDPVTRIATWDERYKEIFGVSGHQRPNEEILARLHPDDLPHVWAAVEAALDPVDPKPYSTEYRVNHPDGSVRWVEAHGVASFEGEGAARRATSFVGTVCDLSERKRAEETLRDSEQFLDGVFERSPHAMWISDSHGTLIRLNQACRDLLRITDAEVVGKYNVLEDNIVAEQGQLELVRRVFEHGETARFTIEYQTARLSLELDRHVSVVLDVTMSPILGADGRVAHAIVQHVDITDRVRAQEALRESATRYQRLHESMRDAFVLVDMSGRILETNPAYREMLGYDAEELSRLTYEDLTPERWHAVQARIVAGQVVPRGHSDVYEKEYIRKDGTVFPVELRTFLLRSEANEPMGMWTIVRDITERNRAEERLREREARYRTLVESLPQGIFMKDRSYRWVSINEHGARDLGLRPGDVVGKTDYDLFPGEVADKYRADDERIMKTGRTEQLEEQTLMQGQESWVNTIKAPVRDETGTVVGVLGVFWDVSERKRAEEEIRTLNAELEQRVVERTRRLEDANQELEAFSYSVSHDLRAPLRHIDGYVGLLLGRCRGELTDQGRHYLDSVADSARQMSRLIDELLQFSRTGRAEMHESGVDMNRTVREALDSVANEWAGRTVEWVIGDLPPVRGDGAMLRLVWTNLLGNAIKYTRAKDRARIEVAAHEGPDETTFSVRDDGVGFDMRYAHKLFGVFQRLHSEAEFEGTGIGLATVRRIVARHGGRTWAEAELGTGAAFYFSLPRSEGDGPCPS